MTDIRINYSVIFYFPTFDRIYKILISECKTNWSGPNPNRKCVFPFRYRGKTYNHCTSVDNKGKPWCPTRLFGNKIAYRFWGSWGHCSNTCADLLRKISYIVYVNFQKDIKIHHL